ncbi:MAG: hypothetical protein ACTS22_01200 [Phycisphaerales bacterium]
MGRLRRAVWGALLAWSGVAACEPEVQAAGASDGPGHAWVVFPSDGGEADEADSVVIVHAPPRSPTGGAAPAPTGRLARVQRLAEAPEWIAASGDRLFAVMPPDASGLRSVGSVRASPRGYQDLWAYTPATRLRVLPPLEGADEVLGVAAFGERLYALERSGGSTRLRWTDGAAWSEGVAGPDRTASDEAIALHADARGPVMAVVDPSELRLFRWVADSAAWSAAGAWRADAAPLERAELIGVWRGEPVLAWRTEEAPGVLRVVTLTAGGATVPVGEVEAPASAGVAVVDGSARVLVVWDAARRTDDVGSALSTPGVSATVQRVAELSLVSGDVVYDGLATTASPVSRSEFRQLAILLFLLMVVVLLVAVRPVPPGGVVTLPPGTALAPASRRILATVVDFVPSLLVASGLLGLRPVEALGPLALPITGSVSLVPLLLTLGIAAVHCGVCEAVFGRSLGKSLAGLIVARVDLGAAGAAVPGQFIAPTIRGSMVRNLVKWFLFPAAALALSDPTGRHRGDVASGAAVLMPLPADE